MRIGSILDNHEEGTVLTSSQSITQDGVAKGRETLMEIWLQSIALRSIFVLVRRGSATTTGRYVACLAKRERSL